MPHSLRHALGTLFLAGSVLLSGCSATAPMTPAVSSAHATLILNPEVSSTAPRRAQALVPRLTADDVDHVRVQLFEVRDDVPSNVYDDKGPLAIWIERSELTRPLVLSQLHPHTHYRVVAWAYQTPDEDVDKEISIKTPIDVVVEDDDRPTVARLPIQLKDVPFDGKATFPSFEIRPGGYAPDGAETVTLAGMEWIATDSLQPVLSGVDEDRMSARAAGPDGKPDAHFHLSADLPPGVSIRVIQIMAVDQEGTYLPGKVWTTWNFDDPLDRLLGVVHDGQLLNTDFVSKLGHFEGPTEFDLYADSPGDFQAGQTYDVNLLLSNGIALWHEFTLPTQQEVSP